MVWREGVERGFGRMVWREGWRKSLEGGCGGSGGRKGVEGEFGGRVWREVMEGGCAEGFRMMVWREGWRKSLEGGCGGRVWREGVEVHRERLTLTWSVMYVESKMTLKLQNKDTHNTYIAISIQHETETLQLHTVHMTAQQLEPTTHTRTHARTQPHGLRHYIGTRNILVTLQ